jgi:hypothetical protein
MAQTSCGRLKLSFKMLGTLFQQLHRFITRFFYHNMVRSSDDKFLYQNGTRDEAVSFSAGVAVEQEDIRFADNVYVTSIEWCKCKSSPAYHEFLLFHVKEGGGKERTTVIKADRNVSKQNAEEPTDRSTVTEGNNNGMPLKSIKPHVALKPAVGKDRLSNMASLSSSSNSWRSGAADGLLFSNNTTDQVIRARTASFETLAEYFLSGNHFSVAQLAVLVNAVHESSPSYKLFEYQCYWFAYIIIEVITAIYPQDAIQKKLGKYSYKRGHVWPTPPQKLPWGFKWERDQERDALVDKYRSAWSEYSQETERLRDVAKEREEQVSLPLPRIVDRTLMSCNVD